MKIPPADRLWDRKCCLIFQVIGVEDFRMGEEICVFIRLGDVQDCDVEEIRDYCREKVRQQ